MSSPFASAVALFDAAVDRVLAVAEDAEPNDPGPRLRMFQGILLLHLAVRLSTGSYPSSQTEDWHQALFGGVLLGSLVLWYFERFTPVAIAAAVCVMFALLSFVFPATGNHFFLELWVLLLLLWVGTETRDDRVVLLGAIRWSVAIMFFYTGLQKVLHGTYFDGQFLFFQMAVRPEFEQVFAWIMPAEELARLRSMPLNHIGSGPFSTTAPLLLVASNVVYLFEMTAAPLLMWKRTRTLAIVAVGLFTVAIQSGAREVYFAGLLANLILLFTPHDLHRKVVWLFVAYYAVFAVLWLVGSDAVFY